MPSAPAPRRETVRCCRWRTPWLMPLSRRSKRLASEGAHVVVAGRGNAGRQVGIDEVAVEPRHAIGPALATAKKRLSGGCARRRRCWLAAAGRWRSPARSVLCVAREAMRRDPPIQQRRRGARPACFWRPGMPSSLATIRPAAPARSRWLALTTPSPGCRARALDARPKQRIAQAATDETRRPGTFVTAVVIASSSITGSPTRNGLRGQIVARQLGL